MNEVSWLPFYPEMVISLWQLQPSLLYVPSFSHLFHLSPSWFPWSVDFQYAKCFPEDCSILQLSYNRELLKLNGYGRATRDVKRRCWRLRFEQKQFIFASFNTSSLVRARLLLWILEFMQTMNLNGAEKKVWISHNKWTHVWKLTDALSCTSW